MRQVAARGLHANAALDELYRRYSALVYGVALRLLPTDVGTAEEVTLDVFVSLWQHAATYDPNQAKVGTWLAAMARNRAIDRLRARNVRPEGHAVALNAWAAETDPALAASLSHEALGDRDRVQSALRRLPTEQAEIIVLAWFYGYTQSELADALNLPLGTIKTRARLAMQKLRQFLDDEI
ncbi:MAG: sigma-70 family RNA polymerase sigma factor [Caldilineaceae bacterium]